MSGGVQGVAVAAPHGLAVDAAEQAVLAGGNALDAALAAAAVLTVVYPHQCSLGGDLTALVRSPRGEVTAVLSLGAAPREIDPEAVRIAGAGRMPGQGVHPITVPGAISGWSAVAGLGAVRPLRHALLHAAQLAADGMPASPGFIRALEERSAEVAADPGLSAVFTPGGRVPQAGERVPQPALAATLRALADDPVGVFYRGPVGEQLVAGLRQRGSALTLEDFAAHAAELAEPLELRDGDRTWWAAPPPSQGAVALALLNPGADGDLLSRARAAHAARARLLGDPRGGTIDVDALLHPAEAFPSAAPAPPATGDTVAVTAVDSEGWSVALIQSVYMTFGAGILEPSTGIVLHNRGGAFVLEDGHPAALAPGHRPPHTLCPLLAEATGLRLALGCQGGRAQALILAQVGPGAADPQADPHAVLAAPRWVVGDRDLGFETEGVLAEQGVTDLPPTDLPLVSGGAAEDRCGHVQLARMTVHGGLEAAADPRADGRGIIIPTDRSHRP